MQYRMDLTTKHSLLIEAQRQANYYHAKRAGQLYAFWEQIAEALLMSWNNPIDLIIRECEQHEQPDNPLEPK